MTDSLHVVISGRVQGVGFRYSARAEALRLGLCGWVRNRADGCVEAFFEGPKERLEQMLSWCGTGPSWASVAGVESRWSSGEAHHDCFEIRG